MVVKGAHIKATGISHTYRRGATKALDGIDLEIQPGEAIALIGEHHSL